jgi:hypothetical protein
MGREKARGRWRDYNSKVRLDKLFPLEGATQEASTKGAIGNNSNAELSAFTTTPSFLA